MAPARRSRSLGGAGLLALALAFAGCSGSISWPTLVKKPTAPEPEFRATAPVSAVRLLEWCWDHRSLDAYDTLLSDDFFFVCAATDSSGSAFLGHGLARVDEIERARRLFVGGGTAPPANSISLQLDQNLISQQDTRPGKQDTTYHQEIITSVVLKIDTEEESFQVTVAARFFLVRGDSALIPHELVARGFRPDTTRWYIERWEDESLTSTPAPEREAPEPPVRAQPAHRFTWCSIKTLYR